MRKGEQTRERILDLAVQIARRDGLEGLTIGTLASESGLSKSGLFAHFGSKEVLQVAVVDTTAELFVEQVILPALRAPRGLPRVQALFEKWLVWVGGRAQGGCILLAAAMELDDKPGAPRERLVQQIRDLLATVAKAARIAVEEKHFRSDLDTQQFAFELHGLMLSYHLGRRLLRNADAEKRAREAFERLVRQARRGGVS